MTSPIAKPAGCGASNRVNSIRACEVPADSQAVIADAKGSPESSAYVDKGECGHNTEQIHSDDCHAPKCARMGDFSVSGRPIAKPINYRSPKNPRMARTLTTAPIINEVAYRKGKPRLLSQGFLNNSVLGGERSGTSLQRELPFIVPSKEVSR